MDNKLSLEASAGGEACDTITNEKVQQSEKKNKGNVETAGVPKGSNFKERGLSALECGLWVDCKFLVGEDEEEIEACSIVLSLASPVFAAMFFGSMPEKEPVKVPDVEPEVFQLLLQFIYAHEVQISSNEEAAKLMVAADKYMLPDLIKTCSEFFTQNINGNDMKDLCDMLNTATLFNREDMKKVALKLVKEKIVTLLSSKEFLTLSADSFVSILKRGHLNVDSELPLISASIRWASARCAERGIPAEVKTLRSILVESGVFRHLRFLSLSLAQLESGPGMAGILTDEEMKAIKEHYETDGDEPPPDSVCLMKNPRKIDAAKMSFCFNK